MSPHPSKRSVTRPGFILVGTSCTRPSATPTSGASSSPPTPHRDRTSATKEPSRYSSEGSQAARSLLAGSLGRHGRSTPHTTLALRAALSRTHRSSHPVVVSQQGDGHRPTVPDRDGHRCRRPTGRLLPRFSRHHGPASVSYTHLRAHETVL